jgi:hypothetical protein
MKTKKILITVLTVAAIAATNLVTTSTASANRDVVKALYSTIALCGDPSDPTKNTRVEITAGKFGVKLLNSCTNLYFKQETPEGVLEVKGLAFIPAGRQSPTNQVKAEITLPGASAPIIGYFEWQSRGDGQARPNVWVWAPVSCVACGCSAVRIEFKADLAC